ncbi:hypothetical protein OG216_36025 [Streptomycetaceae bacterium NBC_01309]
MTTTTPAATAAPARMIAWIAPIGPLAMAGWAFTIPNQTSDEPRVWIPESAAATGRLQLAMVLLLLSALTATAGTLVTGLMARRASRRLGTTGLVLTSLGFTTVAFGGAGYDATAVATYKTVNDTAVTERTLDEYESFIAPMLATAMDRTFHGCPGPAGPRGQLAPGGSGFDPAPHRARRHGYPPERLPSWPASFPRRAGISPAATPVGRIERSWASVLARWESRNLLAVSRAR